MDHTLESRIPPPAEIRFITIFSARSQTVKILFINNDGGGFADHIEVADGTNVTSLFAQRLPGAKAENYLIRVNRQAVGADQVLHEGDRVSITPTKIQGAASAA